MEASEYARVSALEGSHWWYRTLHRSIRDLVRRDACPGRLIDAGCGTGGIRGWLPEFTYWGVDLSADALSYADHRIRIQASVEHLPFPRNQADVLLSIDVLYHAWVQSPAAAVTEALSAWFHKHYYVCSEPYL